MQATCTPKGVQHEVSCRLGAEASPTACSIASEADRMAAAREQRMQRTLRALADESAAVESGQRHDREHAHAPAWPAQGTAQDCNEPAEDSAAAVAAHQVSDRLAPLSSSPAMSGRDVSTDNSLNILPGDSVSQQRVVATPVWAHERCLLICACRC